MKQIFISDLHLDEDREDITHTFEAFLHDHCLDADELYILGDLFEIWLGDDDDSAFNQHIISLLASLSCRKYILHGNRDFLLGFGFCDATGCKLLAEEVVVFVDGLPTLLMHGDSLCTRDTAYMNARKQVRSDVFKAELLSRSLQDRAAYAEKVRSESKAHTRETAMDIMDVTPEEVVEVMEHHGVSRLLHGHTHRPGSHELEVDGRNAKRFVLGDWRPEMVFGIADDTGFSLRSYPAGTPL